MILHDKTEVTITIHHPYPLTPAAWSEGFALLVHDKLHAVALDLSAEIGGYADITVLRVERVEPDYGTD